MAQFSRRVVFAVLALAALSPLSAQAQEAKATGLFHGVGTITEVNPERGFVTVDHDEIKGFMAAMIMSYAVVPGAMPKDLSVGDRIAFAIDAATETIQAIRVIRP